MADFRIVLHSLILSLLILQTNAQGSLAELRRQFDQSRGKERIETGLQIADSLAENPEEQLIFAKKLLVEAQKSVPGTMLLAKVFKQVSDAYYYADSLRLSSDYLLNAIRIARDILPLDTLFLGTAYNDLGMNLQDLGRRTEARDFLNKAISILASFNDHQSLADSKSNLASLSYAEGKFEEAITLFKEAYAIDLLTGNRNRQSSSLNNLGRIYVDWGKFDTGLEYYFKSLSLIDTLHDLKTLAIRYNNIGMAYQLMNRHREAIQWIDKARVINEKEGMFLQLGTRYFNLANSWAALKQYEMARSCFEKSLAWCLESEQFHLLTKVYAGTGQLFLLQGDHAQALNNFRKSLEYAEKGGSLTEKSNSYHNLYQYYKNAGQPELALQYHEFWTAAKDSAFNLDVSRQVEELEMNYQTAQKEAEISRLEAEIEMRSKEISFRKRERNWAIGGFGVVLLFLGGLSYLFATVKRQKAILAVQNKELERLNSTQNRLFGIISHDLRNATAAYQSSAKMISHYLAKGEPEKLSPLVPEISKNAKVLSEMLENLLQWSVWQMKGIEPEKELVPVQREAARVFELLKEYASGKNNVIDILTDGETVWCDPESLSLILRNLVSNALKFTASGRVTIRSYSENGYTIIEVTDTGCGMDEFTREQLFKSGFKEGRRGTSGEKGAGLGMMLVAEHVERNNGTIQVTSRPGEGSTFTVKLPKSST